MKKFIFLLGIFSTIISCSGKKESIISSLTVKHDLPGTYISQAGHKVKITPIEGADSVDYFRFTNYDKLGKPDYFRKDVLCKRTNDTLIYFNDPDSFLPNTYYLIGDNNSFIEELEIYPSDYPVHYDRIEDKE